MIIGVSDENEQKLADHIKAKGIKYPIVRAPGAMSKYGGSFYPSYFTVGPDGRILTNPADRMPSESWFEEALKDVVLVPDLPEDSRFDPLRRAWEKKDYRKIDDYLTKMLAEQDLDAELRAVFQEQRTEFDALLARAEARVESLAEGPDYWRATERLEQIAKDFDGLRIEDAANEVLDRFEHDDAIRKEVSASRTLEKLMSRYDASRLAQRRKLIDQLMRFEERYAGTYAAEQARERRLSFRR